MTLEKGTVVASFGRTVQVEDEHGGLIDCAVFGRRLELVCADRVHFERPGEQERGIVHELLPRSSFISRINTRGAAEPVAANLTQVIVVLAHPPLPDYFLVDRYLAAAEAAQVPAIIVLNKVDAASWRSEECRDELATWRKLGYATAEVSAHTGTGLDLLAESLRNQTSLLVGQSGVGKSSILNALAPAAAAQTREIVTKTGKGSHTTTRTALYKLRGGGSLLDSPGVRDFAPGPDLLRNAADGFPEIAAAAALCRFADCRHDAEPGCAVRAAVEAGDIAERRYRSFTQLRDLIDKLARRRRGY
jgi:ribosome biogenesis GTPase